MRRALIVMSVLCAAACSREPHHQTDDDTSHRVAARSAPLPPGQPLPATPAQAAPVKPVTPVAPAPAGTPPPDGRYAHVMVEGVTVPMINVMNGGTVVLVDTDGKKPRTWEEQYKKKNAPLAGQFDVHKTDANKNGKFEDDAIDREGLWLIDAKGNITKH